MTPHEKVTDIMRKALVVATKLHLSDFREWCECELNGYSEGKIVPEYRHIRGEFKAKDQFGRWLPIIIQDDDIMNKISVREIFQSIGELQHLCEKESDNVLQVQLPQRLMMELFKLFGHNLYEQGMIPTILLHRNQMHGILEAVRNKILEWSLELESEGILGEGIMFSKEEVEKASHTTYNINSFSGVIGNVTSSQLQFGDYNSIHSELKKLGITQKDRNELEKILDEMPKANLDDRLSFAKQGIDWVTRNASILGTLAETIRGWFDTTRC
jgi:hypothetical protein